MTLTNTLNSLPRSFAVGFDSIFDRLESREKASYPPHNIVKHNEDEFEIALAVAGFSNKDLSVKQDGDQLIVESNSVELPINGDKEYLHKGIATQSFIKKFTLADHIRVEQVALVDGILSVMLKREVPEEMKPKEFTILPELTSED